MSTACAKVLGTCGLLEAILEPLAFQELILVQRVSRQFKSVIDGSVVLQQKLYRFPVQGGETSMHPLMAVLGPTGKADNVDNGKDKSWWSMYATQPPMKAIRMRARHSGLTSAFLQDSHNKEGITLGDLHCVAQQFKWERSDVEDEEEGLSFVFQDLETAGCTCGIGPKFPGLFEDGDSAESLTWIGGLQ